jgi:L-2-hydroxyglutarate oxidase LhgO
LLFNAISTILTTGKLSAHHRQEEIAYMAETGITIIGAGIVGLAIAEQLSKTGGDIVVVEQHESFGRETSSRNSQVLHAGLYYPVGSLKARLCVEGNPMMYKFCEEHGISAIRTGKLIPGIDADEIAKVHDRFQLGNANGAADLRMLTREEISSWAPEMTCTESFISPSTGIVDAHNVMARLEQLAASRGVIFAYNSKVEALQYDGGKWHLQMKDADGEALDLTTERVINSSGLNADILAETSGFDAAANGCSQYPGKGEYFRVAERHRNRMQILVYPAVTEAMEGTIAKGVHLVLELDGGMKIGPNTLPGKTDYNVDPSHLAQFHEQMSRYLPWLERADLRPDTAGVRPVRTGGDKHSQDYYISEESDKGLPGLINLIAMNSPALTSCLAIAKYVEEIL